MKQYLDLEKYVLENGTQKEIALGLEQSAHLVIKCVLICRKAFQL